jgi:hypothetical protein
MDKKTIKRRRASAAVVEGQRIPADQTRPDQTRPDQTRPDQTRPDQTRPDLIGEDMNSNIRIG